MSGALADEYDLCIFDLDGVVYVGQEPVPGAVAVIARLHEQGVPVAYATNNASRRAADVAALLAGLGVAAKVSEVVTAGQVTAELLRQRLPAGSPVLVVGAEALAAEVDYIGLRPVWEASGEPVAVVQGYGRNVGWAQLAEGCVAVRRGAWWVATNADSTLPSPRGPLPGNGALVAALATALGRQPDLIVGKPAPALFERAATQRGAERPMVVGDRLDTDIEGANRAGMDSLLVLTGVTLPLDVLVAPAPQRPTYIADDVSGLFEPGDEVRVGTGVAAWTAYPNGGELVLSGAGPAVAALRALCAAAWSRAGGDPRGLRVRAEGERAAAALSELGLEPIVAAGRTPTVRAAAEA